MLKLENVDLAVKDQNLLKNINLDLKKGKIYGLLGPNGAGKTLLFKTMMGLTIHKGEISYYGNAESKRRFGVLIEYPGFYDNLTVLENMFLHLKYLNMEKCIAEDVLNQVGLWKVRKKKFSALSLGMKQRLGIARAFAGNPFIMLLDEPTNGLDPISIKEIRNLIKSKLINDDNCIIISSHNLNEIAAIADELIFIKNGEIVRQIENLEFNERTLENIYEEIIKGEWQC